jgi:hypothetical protein
MDKELADWGVELAFFRTKVGKEFEVAGRVRTLSSPAPIFFGTYGYFDLLAIKCLDRLSLPSLVPADADVLESAPFRFFAERSNGRDQFTAQVVSWPAAIAVFLKINPAVFQADPVETRWKTVAFLRQYFGSLHVFFGLGYSEILVLVGGDNLPKLLETVTELRKSRPNGDSISATAPFFSKTTTFPLVSYQNVHLSGKYSVLKGTVHPAVTITCDPLAESAILSSLPKNVIVHNIYGDTDLIVYWGDAGVEFGDFAGWVSELRSRCATSDVIFKTTSYLETPREAGDGVITQLPARREIDPIQPSLFPLLEQLEPLALRASVADLVLRLSACLRDPLIEADYRDMRATFPYLEEIVRLIIEHKNGVEVMKAQFTLAQIADLGRSAINQRYAGLETHPETLAYSQSPILCDIRTVIFAASALPLFILDNLIEDEGAPEIWAGYVLFGSTYSPLQYHQDILALPATSIYHPMRDWWKITHEVAHAAFSILDPNKIVEPTLLNSLIKWYDGSTTSADRVVSELFANFFDWKYIFHQQTDYFLLSIWAAWIKLPFVWEQKHQYLVRSFAIFMCDRLEEFATVAAAGRRNQTLETFLKNSFDDFRKVILPIDRAAEYFADLTPSILSDIYEQIIHLAGLLHFFHSNLEEAAGVSGLASRLRPTYTQVQAHAKAIIDGKIVSQGLINPCQLHHEILRTLGTRPAPLAAEVAYILSLENWVIQKRAGRKHEN